MLKEIYKFLNPKFQKLFLEYKVNLVPRYGYGKPPHDLLYDIIDSNRKYYYSIIAQALTYKEFIWEIQDFKNERDSSKPTWNNGYLPGLDIIGIYTLIAIFKPNLFLEIGSGNSTKVAYKSIQDQSLTTKIISIDPEPRADIDNLVHNIIRMPFENVNMNIHEILSENDILFIDNSHRFLPNSDSMVFYLEVLPKLKKGVIVHIHDVYLPYDYPHFMCKRFYSEQYGLAMFLLANPKKYEVILPNYFIFEDPQLSNRMLPIWNHPNLLKVERHGGSFWFKINE